MGAVIGDVLTLAVGIAVSPIPIIAAVLMLLSPKSRVTGTGFMLGWIAGIIVSVTVFTLLSSVLPDEADDGSAPISGIIKLLLGAALLWLALRQWRSRPTEGESAALPKWMQAIDTFTFVKALGLAFVLAAVNPKNLLLGASAGTIIGGSGLPGGEIAVVIAVFTVIAASTVALPVIAYLIASEKLRAPLDAIRAWLQKENATIMAVLLLVIGVSMIGKGIGSF